MIKGMLHLKVQVQREGETMTPWSNVCVALPAFDPPCICHLIQCPINHHILSCSKIKKKIWLGDSSVHKVCTEMGLSLDPHTKGWAKGHVPTIPALKSRRYKAAGPGLASQSA